ncbi:hypothetical protein A8F94_14540 [Bacillus sp. FJAT-27225]|uniref:PTS sugar transporter subunit IIA n=1 Tax=Bacillus sp. FJAT-27225 TaxID=1743144 RepID=UPI00080C294C|nr:PTS sugar transporter subunit IIA [Bacillus sp. FJAT-27225]OCA86056.1 hypothetical protein A8F94_14540 [Bacillus sp. FJAT-27225]
MIDKKYIVKNLEVNSQKELLERLGKQLVEDRIVKEGFTEALLEREREFPTGLPVVPGVAIPHTNGSLVNEDRLLFATLKNPIKFNEMGAGEEDFVDVQVVILLAIADGQNHIQTLQKLIGSIQKEGFIKGLVDSKDTEEMESIIRQYL